MNLGIYQGSAAMSALEQWQSSISQNIANASVPGYKSSEVQMENTRKSTGEMTFGTELNTALVKAQPKTNFSQGEMIASGDPLDFAIQGDGFFEVSMPDGRTLYTRDGQFHVNDKNLVVNKNGGLVQGVNGSIQLTPGGERIRIDEKGNIFQGQVPVGQLALTKFTDTNQLQPASGGFVAPESGATGATRAEDARIAQGYLEGGNTNAIREMVQLIAVSRAYEANQKIVQTNDRLLERATTTFGPQ